MNAVRIRAGFVLDETPNCVTTDANVIPCGGIYMLTVVKTQLLKLSSLLWSLLIIYILFSRRR